ncbi:MAG: hypothetical protein FWD19_02085, partial [Defluviitaleaceae bacterium]|nr:hypothetical protein [Defluviitaleaceae bacterium]
NQALYADININKIDDLKALYPNAKALPLTKSYRSTFEIMKLAAKILGDDEPDSFLRSGEPPTILHGDFVTETLKILGALSSDYNTVGILFSTNSEAKNFYSAFKKNFPKENTPRPLKFISDENGNFGAGIMIMAAPFAKGLEFDIVIACGISSASKKLQYLICTRALHKLFLIC